MKKIKPRRSRIGPVERHFGSRIKQARMAAQLSQQELGKACGVSFQMIQKLERGGNRLSASRLVTIAQATGRGVDWFYDGFDGVTTGAHRRPDIMAQFAVAPGGLRLAASFLFTDIAGRRLMVELGEYLGAVSDTLPIQHTNGGRVVAVEPQMFPAAED